MELLELTPMQENHFVKRIESMSSVGNNQNGSAGSGATGNSNNVDWEDFKRFHKNYMSVLAVLKDTMEVLWKFAPIGLVMPAMLIWIYLRKIGWQQLFPETVVSVPGLVVMIVASCLLTILLAIQFGIPSMISVGAVGVYEEQNKISKALGYGGLRGVVSFLFIGSPILWAILFGLLSFIFDLSFGWCFFLGIAGMVVFEFFVVWVNSRIFFDSKNTKLSSKLYVSFKMVFAPTFIVISVFPTLIICMGLFSGDNLSGFWAFITFVGCVIYSVVGVIPGVVYLIGRLSDKNPFNVFKATISIGAVVLYAASSIALILGPVTSTILRSIGAIDDKRYVYQVLEPKLVTGLQGAGFTVYMAGPSVFSDGKPTYFVDGYVRFNFANVLLLCRDPLNFKKADGVSMTNEDVQNKLPLWRAGGYFCVEAHASEVRLLQSRRKS
ncbi:hypothetical protein AB4851_22455 [Burkholderia sp. 22PA0099]|uniref:hypothetical protein n=1 Tax=Burkholderia sp. 22PA0099 TaxID=3237372 RepID=UPI0039C46A38